MNELRLETMRCSAQEERMIAQARHTVWCDGCRRRAKVPIIDEPLAQIEGLPAGTCPSAPDRQTDQGRRRRGAGRNTVVLVLITCGAAVSTPCRMSRGSPLFRVVRSYCIECKTNNAVVLCSRVVGGRMPTGSSGLQFFSKDKDRKNKRKPPTVKQQYYALRCNGSGVERWRQTRPVPRRGREMRCIKIWFGPATPFHAVTEGLCLGVCPQVHMAVGLDPGVPGG